MNPPFGEAVSETKAYLRGMYPWIPTRDFNLLAPFVGRGLGLLSEGGYLGSITSRSGFFQATFQRWRNEVVFGHRFVTMADLGADVMQGALVESAAYVMSGAAAGDSDVGTFVRLLSERDRESGLYTAVAQDRLGNDHPNVVRVCMRELAGMPDGVFVYWDPSGLRPLVANLPSIRPALAPGGDVRPAAAVCVGLQTGDDFRFVRLRWEVPAAQVGSEKKDFSNSARWATFAKGGEYSPYYSDFELLVDWRNGGNYLKSSDKAIIRNERYFFLPGITWPERTVSAFAPQVWPAGGVFSVVGPCLALEDRAQALMALGWLNSRPVRWLIESAAVAGEETKTGGTPARHYTVGGVQRLPWIGDQLDDAVRDQVVENVERIVFLRAEVDRFDEPSVQFVCPAILMSSGSFSERVQNAYAKYEDLVLEALDCASALDRTFLSALGSEPSRELDRVAGFDMATRGKGHLDEDGEEAAIALLTQASIQECIEAATSSIGMARHVRLNYQTFDRRIETVAVAMDCTPAALVNVRRSSGRLHRDVFRRHASDLLSYLFGAAVGRWDVRIAIGVEVPLSIEEVFDPIIGCSRGMLIDADGMPRTDPPGGYPIPFTPDGLLLDEPGHPWDAGLALDRVRQVLFADDDIVDDALQGVGQRDLRAYLRTGFFKEHLARYSKSRRKAPIYWPLYVPSGKWGVWVYAPRLTRETLYRLASEALRREGHAGVEIERLERERAAGGGGRGAKALDRALDEGRKLAEELRRFRQEADRIAGLGWEPDLDDGIVLCAAPLADLFPQWRKELAGFREELRAGKYEWSTVSKWADQL